MTYKTDYLADAINDWLYRADASIFSQPTQFTITPGTKVSGTGGSNLAVALYTDAGGSVEVSAGTGYVRCGLIRHATTGHFDTASASKTITNDGDSFEFFLVPWTGSETVRSVGIVYRDSADAVVHGSGNQIALATIGGSGSSVTISVGDSPVINTSKLTIIEG